MCLETITTYTRCMHSALFQTPCSSPRPSFLSMFFTSTSQPHKTTQVNELSNAFCHECTRIWDALCVTQAERVEWTEIFREENMYHGALAPMLRDTRGRVIFTSDLKTVVKDREVVEEEVGNDDEVLIFGHTNIPNSPMVDRTNISTTISVTSKTRNKESSSETANVSWDMQLPKSRRLSTSSSSTTSSTSTVWPTCLELASNEENKYLVDYDEFGNTVDRVSTTSSLLKTRLGVTRASLKDEHEVELRQVYRDNNMQRLLEEERIKPVSAMVAPKIASRFAGAAVRKSDKD